MQALYNGNKTGGVLGKWPFPPYYWWESGASWDGMVNYWHFTGDNSYVDVTYQGLVSQIGPTNDFMLPQEKSNTVYRPHKTGLTLLLICRRVTMTRRFGHSLPCLLQSLAFLNHQTRTLPGDKSVTTSSMIMCSAGTSTLKHVVVVSAGNSHQKMPVTITKTPSPMVASSSLLLGWHE